MNGKALFAFALFVLLTTILVEHHEPWRDEADAWLMARDATLGEILRMAAYTGTPALWYLIQTPFAKAGADYATQRRIHLTIAIGAAGLLLFCAPFSLPLKLTLAFGYFMSFEYAVVARNYSCGILLCFTALAMDRQRVELAPLYGIAIGLAANASVHFTIFAIALLAPLVWETHRAERGGRAWVGIALGLVGIGIAVWQLRPPPDGQLSSDVFARFEPFRIAETLSQAFAPRLTGGWTVLVGFLATCLTVARLWSAPRAMLVFLLSSAGLAYVFVFKYVSGVRHFGLFLIAIVMALWMAEGEARGSSMRPSLLSRRAFTICLIVLLLPSLAVATRVWRLEVKYAYSEAGDMAGFMLANRLDQARVAAHQGPVGSSVLAWLPRQTFWYPGIGEEGSHMKWDAHYQQGVDMTFNEAVTRMKAQCPDWQNPWDPVLLLLNKPLPDAQAEGFQLLYQTPARPWGERDEFFYLYAPTSFTPESVAPNRRSEPRPRSAC